MTGRHSPSPAAALLRGLLAAALASSLLSCNLDSDSEDSRAPALQSPSQVFSLTVDREASVVLPNTGGRPVNCKLAMGQSLPPGMRVGLSSSRQSCAISGTPTDLQGAQMYTVEAENNSGSSTARVSIAVAEATVASCESGSPAAARTASYRITFTSAWSAANNGVAPPLGAGFSAWQLASHNSSYSMWSAGGMASEGLESLAEDGATSALSAELVAQQIAGTVGTFSLMGALTQATGSVNALLMVSCERPLLSLASRLLGSPDWFVGASAVNLLDGSSEWQRQLTLNLSVFDAGTEGGNNAGNRFMTTGADTTPQGAIAPLVGNAVIGFTPGRERIGTLRIFRETN